MTFVWIWAVASGLTMLCVSLVLHWTFLHGVHPRPHVRVLQWLHAHVLLAALCGGLAGLVAGATAVTGYVLLRGPYGPLQPPQPAVQPHGALGRQGEQHGLGLVAPRGPKRRPSLYGTAGLPAAVDLSNLAPPVGDQGSTNSCASWAVGYALRYAYAKRDAAAGDPPLFAPMYLYAQLAHGSNQPTALTDNLALLQAQGIAPLLSYPQGNADFVDVPTLAEQQAAAPWRVQGYRQLFSGAGQGYAAQVAIEAALAQGNPVVLGIPIFSNVYAAGPGAYYITGAYGALYGYHAVTAFKVDPSGVWIENQWGTGWGLGGWVEISWGFIDAYAVEADALIMPAPAPRAVPSPRPTPLRRPRRHPHHGGRTVYLLMHDQRQRPRPAPFPLGHSTLRRGLLLTATGERHGPWLRFYVPKGRSWILRTNVRRVRS